LQPSEIKDVRARAEVHGIGEAAVDRDGHRLGADGLPVDVRLGDHLDDARPGAARQVDFHLALIVRAGLLGGDELAAAGLHAEAEAHQRLILQRHRAPGRVGHLEGERGHFLRATRDDADALGRLRQQQDVGR
jgi:hypothetical protein